MKNSIVIILLVFVSQVFAQDINELQKFDGTYYLLNGERSLQPGQQQTFIKTIQVVQNNQTILLGTSECEKCTPSIFTYQKEESKQLQKPVFYNQYGLYMIALDNHSFIYAMPTQPLEKGVWSKFPFINFYNKNKEEASIMTKEKLIQLAVELSKKYHKKI